MTRWSLFLQTLSLLHHFLGLYLCPDESQVEGHSLDAQRKEITRWCKQNDYELVRIYSEEGRPAHTERIDRRGELVALLRDAEAGDFDVVVVHNIDRWSRNVGVQRQALQRPPCTVDAMHLNVIPMAGR